MTTWIRVFGFIASLCWSSLCSSAILIPKETEMLAHQPGETYLARVNRTYEKYKEASEDDPTAFFDLKGTRSTNDLGMEGPSGCVYVGNARPVWSARLEKDRCRLLKAAESLAWAILTLFPYGNRASAAQQQCGKLASISGLYFASISHSILRVDIIEHRPLYARGLRGYGAAMIYAEVLRLTFAVFNLAAESAKFAGDSDKVIEKLELVRDAYDDAADSAEDVSYENHKRYPKKFKRDYRVTKNAARNALAQANYALSYMEEEAKEMFDALVFCLERYGYNSDVIGDAGEQHQRYFELSKDLPLPLILLKVE